MRVMNTDTRKHKRNSSFLAFLSLFVALEQEKKEEEKHGPKRHFDAWWDF